MNDESGSLYIADAIIALSILFVAMLMLNTLISIPNPTYSDNAHDSKNAQDIMEILSGKVDFNDKTFLSEITAILKDNKNSKKSVRQVSEICKIKLNSYKLTNYKFCENNKLKGKVLASSGNFNNAHEVSVASMSYGEYSYTLYVW